MMNKTELIKELGLRLHLSQPQAKEVLAQFTEVIGECLEKGEAVSLIDFGTFSIKQRAAREGRHPRTGETMAIPASRVPHFAAGKALKARVQQVPSE